MKYTHTQHTQNKKKGRRNWAHDDAKMRKKKERKKKRKETARCQLEGETTKMATVCVYVFAMHANYGRNGIRNARGHCRLTGGIGSEGEDLPEMKSERDGRHTDGCMGGWRTGSRVVADEGR